MPASKRSVQSREALRSRVRGFYGIADAGTGRDPVLLTSQLLEGGCRLIQIRCKGWSEREMEAVLHAVLPATRAAQALLIVNDWPGLVLATGADGVHVGQSDLPAEEVRRIVGGEKLIGVSHNTPAELLPSLHVADYVAVGPVFPTPHMSLPKPVRGLGWVEQARAMTDLPVVAIGGITPERVPAVRRAGADAWAVIGAVCDAADPVTATRRLVQG